MKPTSNFKMAKPLKRFLATMSKNDRSIYKKAAIDAQLTEEEYNKKKLRVEKSSD